MIRKVFVATVIVSTFIMSFLASAQNSIPAFSATREMLANENPGGLAINQTTNRIPLTSNYDALVIEVNPCVITSLDACADMGNLSDELFHNLNNWGGSLEAGPFVPPSGDTTKRYQTIRDDNRLHLFITNPDIPHTLYAEVEDGGCDDSFEIYVNGQGPLYTYHAEPAFEGIVGHTIPIPASVTNSADVLITFRNIASDSCGLAAVFYVEFVPTLRLIAEIPVGDNPTGVTVNPTSNQIYVTNNFGDSVSVIDGATNTVTATIPVGNAPYGIDVNPLTNKIYVANSNYGFDFSDPLSVIDGNTNEVIKQIPLSPNSLGVAVNHVTNRIYVTVVGTQRAGEPFLEVIDGTDDSLEPPVLMNQWCVSPDAVDVNTNTNSIYVAGDCLATIGGDSKAIENYLRISRLQAVAVNPVTNLVYTINPFFDGPIHIVGGSGNEIGEPLEVPPVHTIPQGVGINPSTNHIFVSSIGSGPGTVAVLDGATNTFIGEPIIVGGKPYGVAVNPNTKRVYVTDTEGDRVVVIEDTAAPPPPPEEQPIPQEVLDNELLFYQTTKDSLRTVDDTYISMLQDSFADLTVDIIKITVSKASGSYANADQTTPLADRALYEAAKKLAIDLIGIGIKPEIEAITRDNLRLGGSLFTERVDSAHSNFISQQVTLSPSAPLNSIVFDIGVRRAVVNQLPRPIEDYRTYKFDVLQAAQDNNRKISTWLIRGGTGLIVKGVIAGATGIAPVLPITDLPIGIAMLQASTALGYTNTSTDVGKILALFYVFRDVVDLDNQIATIFVQELERVTTALETGQLPTISGNINQISVPSVVELNQTGDFGASFENTGQMDIDARLRVLIEDPTGEVRGPFSSEIKNLQPGNTANLAVDIPFPGLGGTLGFGLFGTKGTHIAKITVEFGALGREETAEFPAQTFQVVSSTYDLFKFMSFGSPLTVGLMVTNNDTNTSTLSVVDEIPEEFATDLSSVEFITPPTLVDESNRTAEWVVTLEPGESKLLFYRVPTPSIDLDQQFLFPPVRLITPDGSQLGSSVLAKESEMGKLSNIALDLLKYHVNSQPNSAFNGRMGGASQLKKALVAKIDEVKVKIEEGDYTGALNKLNFDIRSKMDGDSTPTDWIVSADAQQTLLPIIDQLAALVELLSTP